MNISFTVEQINYLMIKLGTKDPDEALDIFTRLIQEVNADPAKIPQYLDHLMKADGLR